MRRDYLGRFRRLTSALDVFADGLDEDAAL